MHIPLDIRHDCPAGTSKYVCASNGFDGCCAVDPCSLPAGCPAAGQNGVAQNSASFLEAQPATVPTSTSASSSTHSTIVYANSVSSSRFGSSTSSDVSSTFPAANPTTLFDSILAKPTSTDQLTPSNISTLTLSYIPPETDAPAAAAAWFSSTSTSLIPSITAPPTSNLLSNATSNGTAALYAPSVPSAPPAPTFSAPAPSDAPSLHSSNQKSPALIAGGIAAGLAALMLLPLGWYIYRKHKARQIKAATLPPRFTPDDVDLLGNHLGGAEAANVAGGGALAGASAAAGAGVAAVAAAGIARAITHNNNAGSPTAAPPSPTGDHPDAAKDRGTDIDDDGAAAVALPISAVLAASSQAGRISIPVEPFEMPATPVVLGSTHPVPSAAVTNPSASAPAAAAGGSAAAQANSMPGEVTPHPTERPNREQQDGRSLSSAAAGTHSIDGATDIAVPAPVAMVAAHQPQRPRKKRAKKKAAPAAAPSPMPHTTPDAHSSTVASASAPSLTPPQDLSDRLSWGSFQSAPTGTPSSEPSRTPSPVPARMPPPPPVPARLRADEAGMWPLADSPTLPMSDRDAVVRSIQHTRAPR